MQLVCKGSVGDAFMFNCILYDPGRKAIITVRQHVSSDVERARQEMPLIQQVYSLSSNVEVEFIGEDEWKRTINSCPALVKGDPPGFRPSPIVCAKKKIGPVTPYPEFKFPETKQDLGHNYIVCSPKAGQPSQAKRDMQEKELTSIVEQYPEHRFVLVGNDNVYAKYAKPNVVNLVGKTSLLEAMGIVSGATGFIGIQGLMAFVALSQKVSSVVYTQTLGHTGAFYGRLFPQWIGYCTLFLKNMTEDPILFHQFMDRCPQ